MPYRSCYPFADNVLAHIDSFVLTIEDDFLRSQYAGFAVIASVTAYETAVKKTLLNFARGRDEIFYSYLSTVFDKLNAKVRLDDLKDYLKRFGSHYQTYFNAQMKQRDFEYIRSESLSIKQAYSDLITWRHAFAHSGTPPTYSTFSDIIRYYQAGKKVIELFDETLHQGLTTAPPE